MLTFSEIRKGFRLYRAKPVSKEAELIQPLKGMLIGILEDINNGETGRKIVLMWLFRDLFETLEEVTTKKLTPADWYALYRWISPYKIEVGKYGHRPGLEDECAAIWYSQARTLGILKETTNEKI